MASKRLNDDVVTVYWPISKATLEHDRYSVLAKIMQVSWSPGMKLLR